MRSPPLPSLARRLATLAALVIGVISSVATSHVHPELTGQASTEPFALAAEPTEARFKLALKTTEAASQTFTLKLDPVGGELEAVPVELELVREGKEPQLVSGDAESWPIATFDVDPVCDDAGSCTHEETLLVRVRRTDDGSAPREVVLTVSSSVLYLGEEVPETDVLTIELVDESAESDDAP